MTTQLPNIPLSNPDITELEIDYVVKVLKSPNLSLGPKLLEFEKKFAEYAGTKYAIAVNSGTSGLHLIIRALDIKDADEVITTPFSFISSANCILFERAKPVFVDISPNTLNIDTELIEGKITEQTKAILAVDVFGLPAQWDRLEAIAQKHNLKLIEDSCEALGAEYQGKKAGSFGDAAVFAFYPNKQMTTGEGGIIVTDNEQIAKLAKSMRNQGRADNDEAWLQHERLGYNYRISDINCALGLAQMERLNELLNKREQVANWYNNRLSVLNNIIIPYTAPAAKRSWFVYVIILSERYNKQDRDIIIRRLQEKDIGAGNYFPPIHLQPFYRDLFGYTDGDFPITEQVSERTIALPFFGNLTCKQVNHVVDNLKKLL